MEKGMNEEDDFETQDEILETRGYTGGSSILFNKDKLEFFNSIKDNITKITYDSKNENSIVTLPNNLVELDKDVNNGYKFTLRDLIIYLFIDGKRDIKVDFALDEEKTKGKKGKKKIKKKEDDKHYEEINVQETFLRIPSTELKNIKYDDTDDPSVEKFKGKVDKYLNPKLVNRLASSTKDTVIAVAKGVGTVLSTALEYRKTSLFVALLTFSLGQAVVYTIQVIVKENYPSIIGTSVVLGVGYKNLNKVEVKDNMKEITENASEWANEMRKKILKKTNVMMTNNPRKTFSLIGAGSIITSPISIFNIFLIGGVSYFGFQFYSHKYGDFKYKSFLYVLAIYNHPGRFIYNDHDLYYVSIILPNDLDKLKKNYIKQQNKIREDHPFNDDGKENNRIINEIIKSNDN